MAATSPTTTTTTIILLITLLTFTGDALSDHPTTTTNLYLSPKTLTTNYNNMLNSFKIFIYQTSPPPPPPSPHHSLFYKSLINSHFITQDPNQAHLFFIPFNPSISTRSLARVIKNIRTNHPFWDRTLGADHFYLTTSEGVDLSSDRNIVELKKNSIQISSFPTSYGSFIPHKDITLPHVLDKPKPLVNDTKKNMFLGYMRLSNDIPLSLSEDIKKSKYFSVESGPLDSKFCLFMYHADVSWVVEAMASRCVPVVITDRPIQDLPLMDVIKWDEIAMFVGPNGGAHGLKKVLEGIEDSKYKMMVESGVLATQHLVWNEEPKPYDAFHMIVYQLWLRRHTVRYARWVE
ncbi:probable glycosyltransferase [Tanacetum coccineum]